MKTLPDKTPMCPVSTGWLVTVSLLAGLSGCGLHREAGLLESDGAHLELRRSEGARSLNLVDAGKPAVMHALTGCIVEVEGRRRPLGFRVERWRVLDAGDGSMPYVGVLRRHGVQLAIADEQTGRLVKLSKDSSDAYREHVGRWVLIMGYQVAEDTVRVVGFRALTE